LTSTIDEEEQGDVETILQRGKGPKIDILNPAYTIQAVVKSVVKPD